MKRNQHGSVLIVGGGIAGMQAALDSSELGLKAYLLEKSPSIGGNMARLDKTFPTNDCAMCMISPKLVETGRHLNIDIISYSELTRVEGEAGDFRVTIHKKARYVDEEKCNGCGECEPECPVVRRDAFNGELSERKAIYRLYPQAIPNVFTIDKDDALAPCRFACPAGVNVQGYVALIAKRKYREALELIREKMPFAGVCGRICHHPCEDQCNRKDVDEPVSIRNLKRFAADYEMKNLQKTHSSRQTSVPQAEDVSRSQAVAVIGGGPSGLTCAHDLVRQGFHVTLFESSDVLGGMMRTGIPDYRLPKEHLDYEIDLMVRDGIQVRTGQTFGHDFTLDELKQQGYQAAFLAMGARQAKKIPLEGSESEGVYYGIPFLRQISQGKRPRIGNKVAVIGGGNVAIDVARSALRLGSQVTIVYRRTRKEMPAHSWEIEEALEEGVSLKSSWSPARVIHGTKGVEALEVERCITVYKGEGERSLEVDPEQKEKLKADTIILATGQECDLSAVEGLLETDKDLIQTDPLTLETSRVGVFAGGDVVMGPSSLVESVAQGHRAAESITRYIGGSDLHTNRAPVTPTTKQADIPESADTNKIHRTTPSVWNPDQRNTNFTEVEKGFTEEEAVREAKRCLQCGNCAECMECVRACKANAIDHSMKDESFELNVGAIIATGGFEVFDANRKPEYGFGRYPNVVTSLQFERILSASGPYEGHLRRPYDGKKPRKIAWIQCVGSRDVTLGNDYCSSVCCMYAIKEAIVAKEHEPEVEPTIFYIDIRAFGKGFESFYQRAKEDSGVRFVRSQISSVKEDPLSRNLLLQFVDESEGKQYVVEEEFDMVVLSVGLVSNPTMKSLADILDVETNPFGFFREKQLLPQHSSREGIFLCGAGSGPKDIPETVMQGSAAAALCSELLRQVRNTEVKRKEYPREKEVENKDPRIGIFVCHCGINISSVVDVEEVSEYIRTIPGVVHAEHTIYTCSQDTQKRIREVIREKDLNRVVVASCTPRTHEGLFQETLREAGMNKYLFEMTDIREQCSWVHQKEPDKATAKAKSLVRGSVGKSRLLKPLTIKKISVTQSALVIGGGISGITAALSLSNQGFRVSLVEKDDQLGGNLLYLRKGLDGEDWQQYLSGKIQEAQENQAIDIYLDTTVQSVSGSVGNFTATLKGNSAGDLKHGVIIVATGAEEYQPGEFLYGEKENVITQRQLEARIEEQIKFNTVVMIQCVGSRSDEHAYCSRVCCSEAIKNAIAIKEKDPDANVYILYRDLRTYTYREVFYRKARELGVRFIHFPDGEYPQVAGSNGKIRVKVRDTVINDYIALEADQLVLSAGIEPNKQDNQHLSELMKLPLDEHGNFMEAHVKLRPVDFASEGIFLCGLAHSPKNTEENITQALAAAGRAATILSRDTLEVGGVISVVDQNKCASCLTCLRECVFDAPFVNADGRAEIDPAKCQGCGNCASACPAKAIQLLTFTEEQENALFQNILQEENYGT
ncbi:MAG: FAD-dependent oxidoreductase [Bacteroidales bacterium]|nr:FAD-dependent oxidoreductase [Bacteroidales bacterium]